MKNESKSAVNWGMICHVAGLTTYMGLPVLGSLFVWLAKRKSDPVANVEGREAVNFNISFTLYAFVAGMLCWILVGFLFLGLVSAIHVSLILWAVLKANKGEHVHYPFTLRFIK
jgi:uncharacterized Tic20 family protein